MHYKNGRPAKLGDKIYYKDYSGLLHAGIVVDLSHGATTCNLTVMPIHSTTSQTAGECVHVDDLNLDCCCPCPECDHKKDDAPAPPATTQVRDGYLDHAEQE